MGWERMSILFIIYMVAGYWATGKTIYADKILIGTWNGIFIQRVIWGTLLGWALIPWAIAKMYMWCRSSIRVRKTNHRRIKKTGRCSSRTFACFPFVHEYVTCMKVTGVWKETVATVLASRQLLSDTLKGNADKFAKAIEAPTVAILPYWITTMSSRFALSFCLPITMQGMIFVMSQG